VAGVAHEINTPLGIGITASTFLEDSTVKYLIKLNAGDATEADTRKFADIVSEASSLIYSNLKRAADQVNSFKTVAVDQASGEFRSFGIKNYINDVLLSLRPKYKRTGHHISLNCPEDLEIYSSPGAFSQIITNLIINSLDHGLSDREAGQMVIDIKRDGQSLLFHYADNGKGMKKETSERIFEPFYTTSKKNGGTGLGMHIVHTIVTQTLKGTIECHSTEGIGTEFLMQVPMMEYA
jgi:signal transduction histidine kinase